MHAYWFSPYLAVILAECYMNGIRYEGSRIDIVNVLEDSPGLCHAECIRSASSCNHWSYIKGQVTQCILFSWVTNSTYDEYAISGPNNCDKNSKYLCNQTPNSSYNTKILVFFLLLCLKNIKNSHAHFCFWHQKLNTLEVKSINTTCLP